MRQLDLAVLDRPPSNPGRFVDLKGVRSEATFASAGGQPSSPVGRGVLSGPDRWRPFLVLKGT